MKYGLSFLSGCLFVALLAASPKTQQLFTIKPAIPKSVMVQSFSNYYNSNTSMVNSVRLYIANCVKMGYVTKTVNITSNNLKILNINQQ